MANLSKIRRDKMIQFLETLKEQHSDDESLIAINQIEKELLSKRYGLVWEEHEENVDVMMRDNVPVFAEVPEREISEALGEGYNFLLEGDNLHSLYLLEKTHKGKVDVIYIDPPYNTGNRDFKYGDEFVDQNDGYKHSKWLSFIEKRLSVAKTLLKRDGIIFVSIDDNEQAQLKMLLDSVFGENNFISNLVWQKKKGGGNDSRHVATEHEYVLVYAKDKNILENIFIAYGENYISRYKEEDEKGKFFWDTFKRKSGKQYYAITCPDGTILEKDENGEPISWLRSEDRFLSDLADGESRIVKINGKWTVHFKQRQPMGYKPRSIMLEYGTTSDGASEVKNLFKKTNYFSNPKPVKLIQYFLAFKAKKDIMVLDFFAGSGTTAQAVLELNKQDGGNRKFILCTNNESNICEDVTYQRIKTVITGKRKDSTEYSEGIPANLKYYRTDFISKDEEFLVDALLEHAVEMIQLEHGIKIDDCHYMLLLSDEEADELERCWNEYSDIKAIYVSQNVLLTAKQETLFGTVDVHMIPDCYFSSELREAGELW